MAGLRYGYQSRRRVITVIKGRVIGGSLRVDVLALCMVGCIVGIPFGASAETSAQGTPPGSLTVNVTEDENKTEEQQAAAVQSDAGLDGTTSAGILTGRPTVTAT